MKTLMKLVLIALVLLPAVASAQPNGYFFPPHWMYDPALGALVAPNRILLPDGTAAAPALAFTSTSNTGFFRVANYEIHVAANGGDALKFTSSGVHMNSLAQIGWTASNASPNGPDTILTRGAANTLYMKNGANAQSFWIANTDDGAGNYERGQLYWNSNAFTISTAQAGTGTARDISILPASGVLYTYNLQATSSDARDFGTAANFYRTAYLSRSIQGSKSKALTDNVATAFVRVAVADDDYEGGVLNYTVFAEDADTDNRQVLAGHVAFGALNNSGTEACNFGTASSVQTVSGGSVTCTFTCPSNAADTVDLTAQCDTTLNAAAETLTIEWRLDLQSPATITPQ